MIRKLINAWQGRMAYRRLLKVVQGLPRAEPLKAAEVALAWEALALSPALPVLRAYLDGLHSEAAMELEETPYTDENRLRFSESLATWKLVGRIRVDIEASIARAQREMEKSREVEG